MWPRRRSDPSETPKPGAMIAGKYRVERVLGEGGMGLVLAARHTKLDELVAIKMLRPDILGSRDEVTRFLREGRACSKLKSEHVVRILDLGEIDGEIPFLVMEQLEGRDLSGVLRDHGPLSVQNTLSCVLEACEAVAEAHALGIIHRDLKPANLFLAQTANGGTKVKVLDFGISKIVEEAANADLSLTATRTLMGSPLYMAPELMRSARAADPRSDVWAIGCILYELLTGVTPWQGETITELCVRVIEETPRPLSAFRNDVPLGLEAVVNGCLAKRPEERFQTVLEVARALAAFLGAKGADQLDAIERVVSAAETRQRDRAASPADRTGDRALDTAPAGGGTLRGFGTTHKAAPGRSRAMLVAAAVMMVGLVVGVAYAVFGRGNDRTDEASAAQAAQPKPESPAVSTSGKDPGALSPASAASSGGSTKPSASAPSAPSAKTTPKAKPGTNAPGHPPKSSPYFDDPN